MYDKSYSQDDTRRKEVLSLLGTTSDKKTAVFISVKVNRVQ